ncbi:hypothetical protein AB0B28_08750 [Glycomyces sp. NPDC046736]|uniref:hypothetical protein n=1 Tax=Glycomyces sp. NPDC046736 TaxID=3155615 RepID=UPI0034109307
MASELPRFVEDEQPVKYLRGFDHALVHCPRCDGMAVRRRDRLTCDGMAMRRTDRLTCESCAYTSDLHRKPEPEPVPPQPVMCADCNRYLGTYRTDLRLHRMVCRVCGWTKEPTIHHISKPLPRTRLWLETDFRGERLWAVNEQHLRFLEDYVAAGVRETGSFNSTLASRLPAWIKSAKNRDDLLKTLAKLRTRLP